MRRLWALSLAIAATIACAPKVPPVAPGAPHYPEFVRPVPDTSAAATDVAAEGLAWGALQAGDVAAAERKFSEIRKRAPGSASALAGLGYVALAKHDFDDAIARFDEAVTLKPALASALVGRGLAQAQSNRASDAIASFEAAQAADSTLDLTARIEALRFRAVEDAVAKARTAAAAGRLDDARHEYEQALTASPDSALLLRELAIIERRGGQITQARVHLERAATLDPADRATRLQIADILEAGGDIAGATRALEAAQAIERTPDVDARLAALGERAELARLPERYRRIPDQTALTRGDLAALLGVRLASLLRAVPGHPSALVTDVSGSWAAPWITAVLRAGVMEAFPNHTFQPDGIIRRADLAAVVSRVLTLEAALDPPRSGRWPKDTVAFSDLSPTHPAYDAASRAVSTRVLDAGAGGAFEPTRPVTGAEAMDAVARLEKLTGAGRRGEKR
jgi:tetratricopeptide (TPR) repeat protein